MIVGGFLWAGLGRRKGREHTARVIYFWAGKFYFGIRHFYKMGFFIYEKTFHTFSLG